MSENLHYFPVSLILAFTKPYSYVDEGNVDEILLLSMLFALLFDQSHKFVGFCLVSLKASLKFGIVDAQISSKFMRKMYYLMQ